METLPKDVLLFKLAMNLDPKDILNLCFTSSRFNFLICNSEELWRTKLKQDYGLKYNDLNSKNVYKRIYENKKYCEETYNLNTARSGIPNILYKVPYFLKEQEIEMNPTDYSVFDDLVTKRFKNGELNEQENLALTYLIEQVRNAFANTKKIDVKIKFLIGFLNGILRGEIPIDADIDNICEFNLY